MTSRFLTIISYVKKMAAIRVPFERNFDYDILACTEIIPENIGREFSDTL
jgi:hypothetical protein